MITHKGSASTDTGRFVNKDKKLASKIRFPPEFEKKVNLEKVALPVIKKWIAERILDILGFEDDIVVQFIFNMLDTAKEEHRSPDPKYIQIYLTGFLEHNARTFTEELWDHLVTACHNAGGIPTAMLKATKKKLATKHRTWVYEDNKEEKNESQEKTESSKDVEVKKEDESSDQSPQLKEMLANIERKRKEREKKIEQIKAIPRSLADCIASSIVKKAKMQEDRERRAELKKIQAMESSSVEKKVQVKKEKPATSSKGTDSSARGSSPPSMMKWEVVKREPDVRQERRSRSRSRKRKRSRSREETPSPSPSPPREWLRHKSKRSSRRKRRSSSSSSSSG